MNKKYRTGTVPVNKSYPIGTVPVNKNYPTGTLINKLTIFSSKNFLPVCLLTPNKFYFSQGSCKRSLSQNKEEYFTKSLKYDFKKGAIRGVFQRAFQGSLHEHPQGVFQEVLKGALQQAIHKFVLRNT